jgi:hypothetical protein
MLTAISVTVDSAQTLGQFPIGYALPVEILHVLY